MPSFFSLSLGLFVLEPCALSQAIALRFVRSLQELPRAKTVGAGLTINRS